MEARYGTIGEPEINTRGCADHRAIAGRYELRAAVGALRDDHPEPPHAHVIAMRRAQRLGRLEPRVHGSATISLSGLRSARSW